MTHKHAWLPINSQGRQLRALQNLFQVGSIMDQDLPNPTSRKRHGEIAVEMDVGIATRHTRANVENVEVLCP